MCALVELFEVVWLSRLSTADVSRCRSVRCLGSVLSGVDFIYVCVKAFDLLKFCSRLNCYLLRNWKEDFKKHCMYCGVDWCFSEFFCPVKDCCCTRRQFKPFLKKIEIMLLVKDIAFGYYLLKKQKWKIGKKNGQTNITIYEFCVDHKYHNWNRTLMSESDLHNTV